MIHRRAAEVEQTEAPLTFLWLELTNACNLECVHCYSSSGPGAGQADILEVDDYLAALRSAASLGCRQVQFIGGEPALNPSLPVLLREARALDFEYIEVYSNLTLLSDSLLGELCDTDARIATSVYGPNAQIHDRITGRVGSFDKTCLALQRLLEVGLPIRVAIIEMDENRGYVDETRAVLERLGVQDIGVDGIRAVGRGAGHEPSLDTRGGACDALCGACADGSLCVGPDGTVYPCIMAKQFPVGCVVDLALAEIAASTGISDVRTKMRSEFRKRAKPMSCNPNCSPYLDCSPRCSPSCSPCFPFNKCRPQVGT